MLVLFPGAYYACCNKGLNLAVSTTYRMENAPVDNVAVPEAVEAVKKVSGELPWDILMHGETRILLTAGFVAHRNVAQTPARPPPIYDTPEKIRLHLPTRPPRTHDKYEKGKKTPSPAGGKTCVAL
jgi:hypothetical protein